VTKIRLLCFLIIAAAFAFASAQSSPRRLREEPLEKQEDPPMFIFRTDTSPGKISQLGTFTSVQVM
jgi:hypothetical protein